MIESRASLASLSGARIGALEVVPEGPELPTIAAFFRALHPVSREATIRRQLLFAAGDTVDTLLVAESLRRLRAERLFSDAVIVARRCEPNGDVALVVRTRDSWTLRPTARFRSPDMLSLGVQERNLFGTGRAVSVTGELSPRRRGAAVSYTDPWLLGTNVAGSLRVASVGGAHSLQAGVRNHEYSVFDPWRFEVNAARVTFGDTTTNDRAVQRLGGFALIGRRVGSSPEVVNMLTVGAEFDSASTISLSRRRNLPGMAHVRSFLGADIGVIRRTAQFDTASWIVPGRGFLDVPIGWEADGVVSAGYSREAHVPAMHLDAWAGRMFIPERGGVLMLDAWTSGYFGRTLDANFVARVSGSFYHEAPLGMWGVRLTGERLLELDPDLRSLSLMPVADYTAPAIQPYVNAGRSIAVSAERTVRLAQVAAASSLQAGAWAAASYRWQVPTRTTDNQLRAGVLGVRLRVLSANGAVNSVRLDFGYPVLRNEFLRARKPFVLLAVGTLFDVSRQRDERRIY